ncbi:RING-H2 finger protein ATL3 [Arachis duranensis]|uniref:RING-type E3 ubiquitin transferase n=1 Tax=Arachis duranensis TaxID=130453 RepID=A0A6P4DM83_ARADU|nr:RING-H2 finger protein ATL3 [Arachis duranensis]
MKVDESSWRHGWQEKGLEWWLHFQLLKASSNIMQVAMGDSSVPSDKLGESPAVELTGKIMVVAVIVLFMVVVFVLFLHLYAKWFWWSIGESNIPQPRRRRRRFVFAPGQDPASSGGVRRGLEPSVLRSLPVLVFQPQDFKEGMECAVCLSEVEEGEKARLLPKCNHGFHVDCIDMWFQSHSTCPLCRNPVTSATESSSDAAFPTNVFVWGNQAQVSSSLEETTTSSSSSSSASSSDRVHHHGGGSLVIDIPSEITSSSASRFAEEDEMKSPITGRLKSLKRLLSRDRRMNPSSPRSIDLEHATGSGQSSS